MLRTTEAEIARLGARTQGALSLLRKTEAERDEARKELERVRKENEDAVKGRDEALMRAGKEKAEREAATLLNGVLITRCQALEKEVESLRAELNQSGSHTTSVRPQAREGDKGKDVETLEVEGREGELGSEMQETKAGIAPELLEEWRRTVTADWEGRMLAGKEYFCVFYMSVLPISRVFIVYSLLYVLDKTNANVCLLSPPVITEMDRQRRARTEAEAALAVKVGEIEKLRVLYAQATGALRTLAQQASPPGIHGGVPVGGQGAMIPIVRAAQGTPTQPILTETGMSRRPVQVPGSGSDTPGPSSGTSGARVSPANIVVASRAGANADNYIDLTSLGEEEESLPPSPAVITSTIVSNAPVVATEAVELPSASDSRLAESSDLVSPSLKVETGVGVKTEYADGAQAPEMVSRKRKRVASLSDVEEVHLRGAREVTVPQIAVKHEQAEPDIYVKEEMEEGEIDELAMDTEDPDVPIVPEPSALGDTPLGGDDPPDPNIPASQETETTEGGEEDEYELSQKEPIKLGIRHIPLAYEDFGGRMRCRMCLFVSP
jgi:hypothetical protein